MKEPQEVVFIPPKVYNEDDTRVDGDPCTPTPDAMEAESTLQPSEPLVVAAVADEPPKN